MEATIDTQNTYLIQTFLLFYWKTSIRKAKITNYKNIKTK